MKNRFGTAAVQPRELAVLAEILREQGFEVQKNFLMFGIPSIGVTIPNKDSRVIVAVGYEVFMATGPIPGFKHDYLGEGEFRLALAI